MRRVEIVLVGYGRVGRALAALLHERGAGVAQRYGLDLRLRRVITSRGVLDLPGGGLPSGDLLGDLPGDLSWAVAGDVLVDATPTDLTSGQPGLAYLRAALGAGMHGVALSKGPLVVGWMELQQLAAQKGVRLMVSGATAAALPAGDTLVYSLTGAEVLSIEGVLNGTTNYILGRMEQGLTYHEALAEAQARGIAERDPRLDVEGWDTAAKMVILANLAWATPAPIRSGAAPGGGPASGAASGGPPGGESASGGRPGSGIAVGRAPGERGCVGRGISRPGGHAGGRAGHRHHVARPGGFDPIPAAGQGAQTGGEGRARRAPYRGAWRGGWRGGWRGACRGA